MFQLFRTLSTLTSIYYLLCLIRLFLTWIPGLLYSPFARFLAKICDPFLNLFSKIRWLRFGSIDLSPIVALSVLSLAVSIFLSLGHGGHFTLGSFLYQIVLTVWSIVAAIILFFIIIVAARLIVALVGGDKNSSLWYQIDSSLSPLVYAITKPFSGGKPVAYRNALAFVLVLLIVLRFGGGIAINWILDMCRRMPSYYYTK